MSASRKYEVEYRGSDVEQAVAAACDALGVAREDLEIQVVSTGFAGILGFGKRPAVIRVSLRTDLEKNDEPGPPPAVREAAQEQGEATAVTSRGAGKYPEGAATPAGTGDFEEKKSAPGAKTPGKPAAGEKPTTAGDSGEEDEPGLAAKSPMEPLNAEELAAVQDTVARLLELSTGPAEIRLEQDRSSGKLLIDLLGGRREQVIGPQGQTLDALQYLLRKMLSKQLGKRVVLELDADGFRAERRGQLESRARELAAEVKNTGKTRTMAAMGPAERRTVHMILQHEEVRSRSVGEGIFKKVLIHPPGKGRRRRKR